MKYRIVEIIKSIILIALTGSAVYLIILANAQTGVASAFLSFFSKSSEVSEIQAVKATAAVRPVKIAVMNDVGRYGVMYDNAAMDSLYTSLGSLLGEALGTMGSSDEVQDSVLETVLTGNGIYFEYPAEVPLSALAEWLGTGHDSGLCASVFILSLNEDTVTLYYIAEGRAFAARTAVDAEAVLADIGQYRPNDLSFAFELAEQYPQFDNIQPLTLVAGSVSLPVCNSEPPLPDGRNSVVSALGFNPYTDASYTDSEGTELFVGNSSKLTIMADGTVIFSNNSAAQQRFTLQSASGTEGEAEVIELVRSLLTDIGTGGGAELMLTGYSADSGGYDITFDYFISGARVNISSGPAVTARIENGILTEFSVILRRYTIADKQEGLMPTVQAAVVVEGVLSAEYSDKGQEQLKVGWKADNR